jgi:hypothetical protein
MNPSPVITACKSLFRIQPFLAHGIISTLRMEDIKIALAKQLHAINKMKTSLAPKIQMEECIESYNILADHIQRHNLEVILALESFTDTSPNGSCYLYPHYDTSKLISQNHSDLLTKKDLFFNGSVPPRKLRFGTFLYYSGLISYYDLMKSIAWQKDRRPLLGQMAMQIGKLSADGFARIIVHVKNGECFGDVARRYHLLSDNVITTLVKAQEKYDCRIGRYFIEKELLTERQIGDLEKKMQQHNRRFE